LALRASRRDDRRWRIRVHRRREAGRRQRGKCRNRGDRRPRVLSHVGIVHAHTSAVVCASVRVDAADACGRRRLVNSGRYRRVISGRRHATAERTQQTRCNQRHRARCADLRKFMNWCLEDVYALEVCCSEHIFTPALAPLPRSWVIVLFRSSRNVEESNDRATNRSRFVHLAKLPCSGCNSPAITSAVDLPLPQFDTERFNSSGCAR
jgi:hypothetical protein